MKDTSVSAAWILEVIQDLSNACRKEGFEDLSAELVSLNMRYDYLCHRDSILLKAARERPCSH